MRLDLGPEAVSVALATKTSPDFVAAYGRSLLLLVRTPNSDPDLFAGLDSTAIAVGSGRDIQPVQDPLQYETVIVPNPQRVASTAAGVERHTPDILKGILDAARYFVVPLRKRDDSDASADRISVGRARNMDIVLRHASVSKFHAWFEMDESGAFFVKDGASKNATRVNNERIAARGAHAVGPGDAVRFGSVDCIICSASALYRAANGARSMIPPADSVRR
jgi:hypothetical protein